MSLVGEYSDEVLERRQRTVHVLEDRTSRIHAWHGGVKVAVLGGWASVAQAVNEAAEHAKHYGVVPTSTMRIRIEEEVSRTWKVFKGNDRWGCPLYDDAKPRQPVVAMRRHVWDDVDGFIAPLWRDWSFQAEEWYGFYGPPSPREAIVATYAGVAVEVNRDSDLYGLYGLGLPAVTGIAVEEAPPPDRITERRGILSFLRVRVTGICPVTAPPGAPDCDVSAFLDRCDVRALQDTTAYNVLQEMTPKYDRWVDPARGGERWSPSIKALAHADA